jgi:hypothetical protein
MSEPTSASNEEYVLGELLGSGLTSDLYLGQYGEGGATVLLKRFHILDVDPARLNRLRWQMLWIGATRYPGLAWMRAVLQDEEGRPILVLQRAGEETLEQFLRRNDWRLARGAALDLVRRLTFALKHAAELGLDYTFIQPSTIMLEGGANPILLGFDLAGDFNLAALAADLPPEQVASLAPEQRSGRGSDERSLVYSLGALFATLIPPARPVGRRQDRVSAEMEALLQTAMAEDPQARYPDLGAFLEALDTALAGEDPMAGAQNVAAGLPATGISWKPSGAEVGLRTPTDSGLFGVPPQPALTTQTAPATRELQPSLGTPPASIARTRRRASRLPLLLLYLLLALIAAGAILLTLEPDLLDSLRRAGMVEDGALPPTPTLVDLGIGATATPEIAPIEAVLPATTSTATLVPATATATGSASTATRPSPTPSATRPTATATVTSSPSPSATIVPPSPTAVIVLPPPTEPPPPPPPTEPPPPPPPPTEPPPPPPPPPPTETPPSPTEPPATPTAPVP